MDGMGVMHDGWITTLDSLEGSRFSTGASSGWQGEKRWNTDVIHTRRTKPRILVESPRGTIVTTAPAAKIVHKSGQGLSKEERWWYRDKEIHGESSDLCAVHRDKDGSHLIRQKT